MASPAELRPQLQFAEFVIDLRTGELWRDGKRLALPHQSFQILTALLENPGQLVAREELVKRLWESDVFVEFEGSLNKAVKRLRELLQDSADRPRFIETLPRRGYRFIAPVRRDNDPAHGRQGLIGKKVSHYRVLEVIGGGGMGMVFKAEDLKLGRQVALKFLPEELASDAVALRRFEREARTASSLNHPNICTIYEIEEHEGQPFIVMELLEGETLRDRLRESPGKATSLNQLLDIAIETCTGLEAAHQRGIIHRDIKPANIFITLKGAVKILDFGLAKLVDIERGAPDELPRPSPNGGLERRTQAVEALDPSTSSGQAFSPMTKESSSNLSSRVERVPHGGTSEVEGPAVRSAEEKAGPSTACPPGREDAAGKGRGHSARDDNSRLVNGVAEAASLHSATPADHTLTRTGVAMGTAGYMSPEQVRGEKLDARTDIFSFGLVLYEMATGQRAFTGETAAVVHDAILNRSPTPVRELNSTLPAKLVMAIDKALEKDRAQRYESAAKMGADLREVKGQAIVPPVRKTRASARWVLVGLMGVVLCLGGYFAVRSRWRGQQTTKEPFVRQLTSNLPDDPVVHSAISPDGKYLAYTDKANGVSILQIDGGETRTLPNTRSLVVGNWLDDDHVSVWRDSSVWKLSTIDGTLRKLPMPVIPSPDGTRLLGLENNEIWLMNAEGENAHRILRGDPSSSINDLAWSPSGQRFAYVTLGLGLSSQPLPNALAASINTCDLAGKCTTVLSDGRLHLKIGSTPIEWLADGRVVFGLSEPAASGGDTNLWALNVDPNSGRVLGEAKRLTNWTTFSPLSMSSSRDGKRLVFANLRSQAQVKVADLQKGGTLSAPRPLNSDTWPSSAAGWTADSQTVLFTAARYGRDGIFAQTLSGGAPHPLVSGPDSYDAPVITPDGRYLLYTAQMGNGTVDLMRMPFEGGPATVLIPGNCTFRCASSPATLCVVSEAKGNRLVFASLDPLIGRGPELATVPLPSAYYWSLSADGKSIALVDHGASGDQVRILSTEGGGVRVVHVKGWDLLQSAIWAGDGKHLYVSGGYGTGADHDWGIVLSDLNGKFKVLLKAKGQRDWVFSPIPSPDGRHLIYSEQAWESNIVMMENF